MSENTPNKHTIGDLAQMQSLPLHIKIRMTQRRIRDWYNYYDGEVYVSFSGGKDSTVLLHLVRELFPDVEAVFVNTGLEYPEIQKFVKSFDNVTILRPEMRFDEVIKKYGYPLISKEVSKVVYSARKPTDGRWKNKCLEMLRGERVREDGKPSQYNKKKYFPLIETDFICSHKCCDVMKKKPAKQYEKKSGKKPIIATMADESVLRKTEWQKNGCNGFEMSRPRSVPMSFWTEQDVLQYIKENNIPVASVYGQIEYETNPEQMRIEELGIDGGGTDRLKTTGCDRTGCIFCAFGSHREQEPSRFQRLKETHPRQYQYCIGGGEYVWKGNAYTSDGEPREIPWLNDDNSPMTDEQIEEFIKENKDNPAFKFEKVWQPSKEGLGMGHIFDELNKIYGDGFIKY